MHYCGGVWAPGEGLPVGTEPWEGEQGCPHNDSPGATSGPVFYSLPVPSRLWAPERGKPLHPQSGGWVLRSRQAESVRMDTPVCSHAWGTSKFWVKGANEVTLAVDNWTSARASG